MVNDWQGKIMTTKEMVYVTLVAALISVLALFLPILVGFIPIHTFICTGLVGAIDFLPDDSYSYI